MGDVKRRGFFFWLLLSTLFVYALTVEPVQAADVPPAPSTDRSWLPIWEDGGIAAAQTPSQVASVLQTVALLTFLTLAPSFLILTTCFTRIIIVLSFIRRALATQTLPPDQVLIGLSLFLTIFLMGPTWKIAWDNGIDPYLNGAEVDGEPMTQEEAFGRILAPQRRFMFACLEGNESRDEVLFFLSVAGYHKKLEGEEYFIGENNRRIDDPNELQLRDIPTTVLIPSFITSELKRGFWMGFLLYVPFLILDMVIASILMAMGMMMLPPVMVSLPFKIILFVLVDGWRLVMEGIVTSFPLEVLQFSDLLVE